MINNCILRFISSLKTMQFRDDFPKRIKNDGFDADFRVAALRAKACFELIGLLNAITVIGWMTNRRNPFHIFDHKKDLKNKTNIESRDLLARIKLYFITFQKEDFKFHYNPF